MRRVTIAVLVGLSMVSVVAAQELDSFHLQDSGAWSCSRRIVVRPLALTGTFKGKRTQSEYMTDFVTQLSMLMTGRSGVESVSLVEGDLPAEADMVIEGRWKELNTGSRAARFWVGFGAGRARAEVALSARTLPDNRPVFDLAHARASAMGLSADELKEDVVETASDIAEALIQARGACYSVPQPAPLEKPPSGDTSTVPVAIESEPAGADVYIDEAYVGTAPLLSFRLSPGEHAIEIRKAGFEIWKRTARILVGSPTQVKAVLVPEVPKQ